MPQDSKPLQQKWTASADLKRGMWAINEKIVSEAEGRSAFASMLKAIAEAENALPPIIG